MTKVNIYQVFYNQGITNQLWLDSNTDVLPSDQNGSQIFPYNNIIDVFNHINDHPDNTQWHIRIAIGQYPDSFSIPESKLILIEGPINGLCLLFGNITWSVTGDFDTNNKPSIVGFRNVSVLGNLDIIDGTTPAINAGLVGENVVFNNITSIGTSKITTSLVGTSTTNFNFNSPLVAGRVVGNISLNGLLFVNNIEFFPSCTLISVTSFFANGSNFSQSISCSDGRMQILSSIWNVNNTVITFSGSAGTAFMDESSTASFVDSGGKVINGQYMVSTQRATGWLSGGAVDRINGLNISVQGGSGYIFEYDDVTAFITWPTTTINLTPNQLLYIYIDTDQIVKFGTTSINSANVIILATAFTSTNNVVFLNKGIVEAVQIVSSTDNYLKSVIGPIQSSGLLATIHSPPSLKIDVQDGYFFNGILQHHATAHNPITFTYWYQDGAGGWHTNISQTSLDPNNYDNGTGTLSTLLSGQWKKDVLYVSTSDDGTEYHIVYAQTTHASQLLAETGALPTPPSILLSYALQCAGAVIQGASSAITSLVDERIKIGQVSGTINSVNALTPTQHEVLRQGIHFIDSGGPADGFASGAFKTITPNGSIFPTNITWYIDNTMAQKIVEKIIVWTGVVPSVITWNVYNVDGITIAHTVSDTIAYTNNIFETSRIRAIS